MNNINKNTGHLLIILLALCWCQLVFAGKQEGVTATTQSGINGATSLSDIQALKGDLSEDFYKEVTNEDGTKEITLTYEDTPSGKDAETSTTQTKIYVSAEGKILAKETFTYEGYGGGADEDVISTAEIFDEDGFAKSFPNLSKETNEEGIRIDGDRYFKGFLSRDGHGGRFKGSFFGKVSGVGGGLGVGTDISGS